MASSVSFPDSSVFVSHASALISKVSGGVLLVAVCWWMVGCGVSAPSSSPVTGGQLRGNIHGGQQPVSGSSVQLYAAGTAGYGSAATPLLASALVTDGNGDFTIPSGFTCPDSTSQLYIVATGGNPGLAAGTNNAALALMAALGPCSLQGSQYTLNPNSFIFINEVTTVASVYALSAFMGGDATHLGASGTNAVGLANSFQLVNNLANTGTGMALTTTPAGNGTAPQAAVNTLADVLAACVNSDGTGAPCGAVFSAATPSGGTKPADTIQAIYDIARNPANNVSALYAQVSGTAPFTPTYTTVPNDWMLSVTYTGGGLAGSSMAIDASGDVWVANSTYGGPYSVTELSSFGAVLSGASGYSGGGMMAATGIAIDPMGNAWIAGASNVVKLSGSGMVLSGMSGYSGGGLTMAEGIAIDGQGAAWLPDYTNKSVIKLDNSGNVLSGALGFATGAANPPRGVGIDVSGDAWVGNPIDQTVTEFNTSGAVISGSGYAVADFQPVTVAFDLNGNAWTNTLYAGTGDPAGLGVNNVAKLSSSGTVLSPDGGYQNCISPGIVGDYVISCIWWLPDAFALDGAGNVWGVQAVQTKVNGRVPNPMYSSAVTEISNTGTILSGANGYVGSTILGPAPANSFPADPQAIAVDGGGNVWMLFGQSVSEFVGAGTPVVTPFSLGVKNGTLGGRP